MFTLTISLDSLATYIVVADILLLLTYILYIMHRQRQSSRAINSITDFITVYFSNGGADVRVMCFKLEGEKRYIALVESEPLKRFRHSNILESNLITHILKATGKKVEKIYWRFPVQLSKETLATSDGSDSIENDLYFAEGYALANMQSEYKVSEVPWDQYENSKAAK